MEALLVSIGIVTLAEIGDKTQLLTLVLAARYRKPWPIVAGIFVATLANHALAGALGAWLTRVIGPDAMRWVLGLSFIAMELLDGESLKMRLRRGPIAVSALLPIAIDVEAAVDPYSTSATSHSPAWMAAARRRSANGLGVA